MTELATPRQTAELLVAAQYKQIEGEESVSATDDVAVAYALKEICLEAWSTDPQRCKKVAGALSQFAEHKSEPEVLALELWTSGIASIIDGNMSQALDALDAAAGIFLKAGRKVAACELCIAKLIALSTLGRHEEAELCASEIREVFIGANAALLAGKVELNLGSMMIQQGRHVEAARYYRFAAVRFARAGDIERSIMADTGLALALTWQHQFDEARLVHERGRMRATKHNFPVLLGLVESSLGQLELFQGHFRQALKLLESWRHSAENMKLPQRVMEVERNLADAYLAVNLLPEAIALCDRVIAGSSERGALIEAAWAYVQHGRALMLSGEYLPAARSLCEARQLFEKQNHNIGLGLVDLWEADLALVRQDWQLAKSKVDLAHQCFLKARLTGWRLMAEVTAARCCLAAGDLTAAETWCKKILAETTSGAYSHIAVRCLDVLANIHEIRHEAVEEKVVCERAANLVEHQLSALPGDAFRVAMRSDFQFAYDGLVRHAAVSTGPTAAEETLIQIERARAQSFLAEARRIGNGSETEDATESIITKGLRRELNFINQRIQQEFVLGKNPESLLQESVTLEAKLLESVRRAQVASDSAPAQGWVPLDLNQLGNELGTDTALIEYFLLDDALVTCVVNRHGTHKVVTRPEELLHAVQQCRFQLDSLRFGARQMRAHAVALEERMAVWLRHLYRSLVKPIQHLLADVQRLVIVPHGYLQYVPFAALLDGGANGERALIDRFEIALSPGAGFLLNCLARARARWRTALVIGAEDHLLEHVNSEVDTVANAFSEAKRLKGAQATKENLKRFATSVDVLHVACHGRFRADSPYFSSLQLADSAITVHEIQELKLSASLVTLSACETAISQIAPGEEMIGLARSFFVAGVPSLLASAWSVDDEATSVLMQTFYQRLQRGRNPAAALRAAQLALRKDFSHPYYWAAFALNGRW